MKLRPPPPPPLREISSYGYETTDSIIRRELWEEDCRKWHKEVEQYSLWKESQKK